MQHSERSQRIADAFNKFTGKNTQVLRDFYDDKVRFEDPVKRVEGLEDLIRYYKHAYDNVSSIRFEFKEIIEAGETYSCEWFMHLTAKGLNCGKSFPVRGVSVLTFSPDSDKVIRHNDYLDLGDMVYERLPLVGKVVSLVKGRLKH